MKKYLRADFIPSTYEHDLATLVQALRQNLMTITDYTEQFHILYTRANLNESEEQKISRYISGLQLSIKSELHLRDIATLEKGVEYTRIIEEYMKFPTST